MEVYIKEISQTTKKYNTQYVFICSDLYSDIDAIYKNYEWINLVAHSWGTVLTKDLIINGGNRNHVNLWATMGSPLPESSEWVPGLADDNCTSEVAMSTVMGEISEWKNFYSLTDPVVYLRISSPNKLINGVNLYRPLFLDSIPRQHRVTSYYCGSPHSIYWTDPDVLLSITRCLNMQK